MRRASSAGSQSPATCRWLSPARPPDGVGRAQKGSTCIRTWRDCDCARVESNEERDSSAGLICAFAGRRVRGRASRTFKLIQIDEKSCARPLLSRCWDRCAKGVQFEFERLVWKESERVKGAEFWLDASLARRRQTVRRHIWAPNAP